MDTKSKIFSITGILIMIYFPVILSFKPNISREQSIEPESFSYLPAVDHAMPEGEKFVEPENLKVFNTPEQQQEGRRMFSDFVQFHIDSLEKKRIKELNNLGSPDEWRARQNQTREQLHRFFGEFPEKTPLNAKTLGKLEHELYTIEKVIFESQPNFYVTANLYIPKGREFPLPGVIFPCGHSANGKAYEMYHMSGLGLVLKGYVVLVFDPIGQGERSEYFDPVTGEPLVRKGTGQHHYVGRPAFLLDWSLVGLRTWDAIRAVDYLVSRPEVDINKLAAAGCSGGGQMSMLITAVDERIKVCAASHAGGSMEETYLLGFVEKEIFSLIPPRPIRIIVGNESGEEPLHREKIEDMRLFYEGLMAGKQTCEIDMVPGVHSMSRPNRESAYEWLNKWLDKQVEGKAEAVLEPETEKDLWCTERGNTLISLGGETGQSLNMKRVDMVYKPEMDINKLKERITARIGLSLPEQRVTPKVETVETLNYDDIYVEKLSYESEKGIVIPSLLITPKDVKSNTTVYLYVSDKGKPLSFNSSLLPFLLAKNGFIVLAIDVRGIGETSPLTSELLIDQYNAYTPSQWQKDRLAIKSCTFERTTLAMRTFDIIRGLDFIDSRDDLKKRKVITIGEGLGGLWALLSSVYDSRVEGVVTIGTLPSYLLLVKNKYYKIPGEYFWVPGALRDFDIPDLTRLVSPKPQIWIDPINNFGEKLLSAEASPIIKSNDNLHIFTPDKTYPGNITQMFDKIFK